MTVPRWWIGELLGTFLLVFFGCGSVAVEVTTTALSGNVQVGLVWGAGLVLAISLTGKMSGAHLNPAITVALVVWRDFPKAQMPGYFLAQCLGALVAAAMVYLLCGEMIVSYEKGVGVVRGEAGSELSAKIFGEYFPNPSGRPLTEDRKAAFTAPKACLAEAAGTALLALAIFGFTGRKRGVVPEKMIPWAIGTTLTILIILFAPMTQAGFNPARDLMPRIFSSLVGWESLPFSMNGMGWLTVYVISPVVGAVIGGGLGKKLFD